MAIDTLDNLGWVKLYRKIMNSDGYFAEPFCRNMAWIDLILLANHDDNFFLFRGIKINVKRGQVGYGIEALSKRWKWSRNKVDRFMRFLENTQKVDRQKTNITTLTTILNYHLYQGDDTANGQQTETNKKNTSSNTLITMLNTNTRFVPSSPAPAKKTVGKKKNKLQELPEPHWYEIVKTWFDFNVKKFLKNNPGADPKNGEPLFEGTPNPKKLKKLIGIGRKKAEIANAEWTKEVCVKWLLIYLFKADKDEWRSQHFTLDMLLKDYDVINQNPHGTQKRKSGNSASNDTKRSLEQLMPGITHGFSYGENVDGEENNFSQ